MRIPATLPAGLSLDFNFLNLPGERGPHALEFLEHLANDAEITASVLDGVKGSFDHSVSSGRLF